MRDRGAPVRRRRLAASAAVALLVTGATAGCTDDPPDEGALLPPSPPAATAVSDLDLTAVVSARAPFCDALEEEAVEPVLGGEPVVTDSYASGDRTELAPGLRDVAHEFSCYFERGPRKRKRTARAWLFAQSVSQEEAGRLVRSRSSPLCRAAGELSFGDPGLVQSCSTGDRRRVTAAGLFGDGWLTCQATAPVDHDEAALLEVTQRWCAHVAQTTDATP